MRVAFNPVKKVNMALRTPPFVILIAVFQLACGSIGNNVGHYYSDGGIRTRGFDEVRRAKDGERITLTADIDAKVLCKHTEEPSDICITAALGPIRSDNTSDVIEIKLRVCSEQLRRNCIVVDTSSTAVDYRDVYVLEDAGQIIDFDGTVLVEPPNTWTSTSQPLRLTGLVTVIDGEGRLVAPIEKIQRA